MRNLKKEPGGEVIKINIRLKRKYEDRTPLPPPPIPKNGNQGRRKKIDASAGWPPSRFSEGQALSSCSGGQFFLMGDPSRPSSFRSTAQSWLSAFSRRYRAGRPYRYARNPTWIYQCRDVPQWGASTHSPVAHLTILLYNIVHLNSRISVFISDTQLHPSTNSTGGKHNES